MIQILLALVVVVAAQTTGSVYKKTYQTTKGGNFTMQLNEAEFLMTFDAFVPKNEYLVIMFNSKPSLADAVLLDARAGGSLKDIFIKSDVMTPQENSFEDNMFAGTTITVQGNYLRFKSTRKMYSLVGASTYSFGCGTSDIFLWRTGNPARVTFLYDFDD